MFAELKSWAGHLIAVLRPLLIWPSWEPDAALLVGTASVCYQAAMLAAEGPLAVMDRRDRLFWLDYH